MGTAGVGTRSGHERDREREKKRGIIREILGIKSLYC